MEEKLRKVSLQYFRLAQKDEKRGDAAGYHAAAIYHAVARAFLDLADELAK